MFRIQNVFKICVPAPPSLPKKEKIILGKRIESRVMARNPRGVKFGKKVSVSELPPKQPRGVSGGGTPRDV